MFSGIYDRISLLLYRQWPAIEGTITAVDASYGRGLRIVVVYEFSIPNDGPYTGESSSPRWFGGTDVLSINKKLAVGQRVAIRYRPDCPGVNKLDRDVWTDLEDGL